MKFALAAVADAEPEKLPLPGLTIVNDVPVPPVGTVIPVGNPDAPLVIVAPSGMVTDAEVVIVVPEIEVTVRLTLDALTEWVTEVTVRSGKLESVAPLIDEAKTMSPRSVWVPSFRRRENNDVFGILPYDHLWRWEIKISRTASKPKSRNIALRKGTARPVNSWPTKVNVTAPVAVAAAEPVKLPPLEFVIVNVDPVPPAVTVIPLGNPLTELVIEAPGAMVTDPKVFIVVPWIDVTVMVSPGVAVAEVPPEPVLRSHH